MRMKFEVTYEDGRKVVASAGPKDFVSFERQYGHSVTKFSDDTKVEWIYYLAWAPLHRTRVERADFDTFLDLIDDVDPVEDEPADDVADPTQTAPSPEISADSP